MIVADEDGIAVIERGGRWWCWQRKDVDGDGDRDLVPVGDPLPEATAALAERADALGRGEKVAPLATGILEAGRIGAALDDHGTVVNYGLMSGQNPQLGGWDVVFRGLRLAGFWLVHWFGRHPRGEIARVYGQLAGMLANRIKQIPGAVDTHVHQRFDQPEHTDDKRDFGLSKAIISAIAQEPSVMAKLTQDCINRSVQAQVLRR